MPCEAWKRLAIVTGILTIVGEEAYQWRLFGFFWPRRITAEERAERHARFRPLFPAWALCGFVALVSLIVYLSHCTD
jgi:hypothetical protein